MDENDDNSTFLVIDDRIEYVQLIVHWKEILLDMFSNDNNKVEDLKAFVELFHIVNILVLYK
jgi:hypothetical protein